MLDAVVPLFAALLAGALSAVAGGRTFLTFPALIHAGVPPIPANAISMLAVFPGCLGGALGFRRELAAVDRSWLLRQLGLSLLEGTDRLAFPAGHARPVFPGGRAVAAAPGHARLPTATGRPPGSRAGPGGCLSRSA